MTRKVNVFWILYGMVLTVLFLLSSTDLIIKEEAAEIYPVSVIIGDASDENYVNFRKGMDRAAVELNADVSFITLYEEGSEKQQRELILRELADGAGALVVAPVEADLLCEMEQESRFPVPVILINGEYETVCELERSACFTFDYYGMGRKFWRNSRSRSVSVFWKKKERIWREGFSPRGFKGLWGSQAARCFPLRKRQTHQRVTGPPGRERMTGREDSWRK